MKPASTTSKVDTFLFAYNYMQPSRRVKTAHPQVCAAAKPDATACAAKDGEERAAETFEKRPAASHRRG